MIEEDLDRDLNTIGSFLEMLISKLNRTHSSGIKLQGLIQLRDGVIIEIKKLKEPDTSKGVKWGI